MSKATNVIGYSPNWDNIEKLVDEGFIRRAEHPDDSSLVLHNYTPKTQYDQKWTKDTLLCRGLISREGKVVARPFSKFFNYSEFDKSHANVLKGPWDVYEKLDGSLGIMYEYAENDYRIATRGAFESDQALWATEWLKENHPDFLPMYNTTWLFEIIYPTNRIVVDYGDIEGLVLLSVLNTRTGGVVEPYEHPFESCEYHGLSETIPDDQRHNKEGYVLVNPKGFRVKVKHDDYIRLHKIITGCSNRMVWEYLKDGLPFDELIDNVPDEFNTWVTSTIDKLKSCYHDVEEGAKIHYLNRPDTKDRKTLAEYFTKYPHPFLCFAMLDGKDYSEKIWQMIKPERELPFVDEV